MAAEAVSDGFVRQVRAWGLDLSTGQIGVLHDFGRRLSDYSEANVIGTRSFERIMEDHVLDSLSCLLYQGLDRAESLVDVGSGAGLPGIPLKLVRPELRTTLLEATSKKARFMEAVVQDMGLEHASVVHGRAEETGHQAGHRARYDIATARALAPLAVLAEYCLPLLKMGGALIAMKARLRDEELNKGRTAAKQLGGDVTEVVEIPLLPEIRAEERRLIIIEKVKETPSRYPRSPGVPGRKPLGGGSRAR